MREYESKLIHLLLLSTYFLHHGTNIHNFLQSTAGILQHKIEKRHQCNLHDSQGMNQGCRHSGRIWQNNMKIECKHPRHLFKSPCELDRAAEGLLLRSPLFSDVYHYRLPGIVRLLYRLRKPSAHCSILTFILHISWLVTTNLHNLTASRQILDTSYCTLAGSSVS